MRTSWISLRRYYGLAEPYDFRVAAPFLLNAFGIAIAVVTMLVMTLNGALTAGTERFFFFLYLVLALGLATASSRAPRLSMAIFVWCCIEAVLALSSAVLPTSVYAALLLPRNYYTQPVDRRFKYHPLLQFVPRPNWQQSLRLTERIRPTPNMPTNWKRLAGEFKFSHNSLGLRGPELTVHTAARDMIFIYGGSSTYDVTVNEGDTWVEQLQAALQNRFTLLNFGVPGYSTAEHLIQTAFYQEVNGRHPVCAVYYVGWNDIHNAHIDHLDRSYANWHWLGNVNIVRRPELWAAKYSPIVRLVSRLVSKRFDTAPDQPIVGEAAKTIPDPWLENIFVNNVSTLASINHSRGIRTVFIGQILNKPYFLFQPEEPNIWAPGVKNKNVWATQERFNALLKDTAAANGAAYIDAGVQHFTVDDFVDQGHFAAAGSRKFARLVASDIQAFCQGAAIR